MTTSDSVDQSPEDPPPDEKPPDPNWRRTLWIVFFAQLVSVIGFATIFPFLPLYVKSLGSTSGLSVEFLSGLVFSAQGLTMMISSPLWGAVADRYGRKAMIERAAFGGALVVLLMGFASSAEMLIFLRAVQGAITGTISAANALIAAAVPRQRMGYAMGVLQVALWSGVAIGPLLGGILADAFGYRLSFILTSVLLFAGGVLVWWGVNEEFVPNHSPAAAGVLRSILDDWRDILTAPGVKIAYLIRFMVGLGQIIVVPLAPLFVLELLPANAPVNFYTGLIIGVGGFASTATAVLLGRLGDRLGHRRILMASTLLAALAYLPQGFVTAAWQLLILQALTGAALGGIITSVTASLAQFTTPGEEGSVYGLDNAIVAGARVVAPLVGATIATLFSLRAAISLTGVLFLLILALEWWRMPRPEDSHSQPALNRPH